MRARSAGSSGSGGMFIEKSAARPAGRRLAVHYRGAADESASADDRFDEAALSRLDIAARDRREVERKPPRQCSLRRQAIAGSEPSGRDVAGDRVRDREVARTVPALQRRGPCLHCGETRAGGGWIDRTVLLWDRNDIGRLSVHLFGPYGEAMT